MKRIIRSIWALASLLAVCLFCSTALAAGVSARFSTPSELPAIGQPYVIRYELSGGSGTYEDASLQLTGYRNSGSVAFEKSIPLNASAGECTITPEAGTMLMLGITGKDANGTAFSLTGPELPVDPNPDLPVSIIFGQDSAAAGSVLNAAYSIEDGGAGFETLEASWTVADQGRYTENIGLTSLTESFGAVSCTVPAGRQIYLVMQGVDANGRFVYAESDPITVTSAAAQEITAGFEASPELPAIGMPFSLTYHLEGGSGIYADVEMILTVYRDAGSAAAEYRQSFDSYSGTMKLIPEEGSTLTVRLEGVDSTGAVFAIEGPELPVEPNPDLPISVTFDQSSVPAGSVLNAAYRAEDGGKGFESLEASWIVYDQGRYTEELGAAELTDASGTVSFTPASGQELWLVIRGADANGRFVYAEFGPVSITAGAAVQPISASFRTSTPLASIGQPITISYELTGGSGVFREGAVKLLYYQGNGTKCDEQTAPILSASGSATVTPEEGQTLVVQLEGYDSAGRSFAIEGPEIPVDPNPDLPVSIVFETAAEIGETLTASYSVEGAESFVSGSLTWVAVQRSGSRYVYQTVAKHPLTQAQGSVSCIPAFGQSIYLVLKGTDASGRFVYHESGSIKIDSSKVAGRTLILPQGLTSIGPQAFVGVDAVKAILPSSVTSIADDAFDGSSIVILQGSSDYAEEYALGHGLIFVYGN